MSHTVSPQTGAMSEEAMANRLSTFPGYRAGAAAPAVEHAEAVRSLWGARMAPIMAHAGARGRFANAALACPPTACTGLVEMAPGAESHAYRNPHAIENILCLDGALEVHFGPLLGQRVTLGRFDMLSMPANVFHSLRSGGNETARMAMVLSIEAGGDYAAIFDDATAGGTPTPAALAALAVSFDAKRGIDVDATQVESRITRFENLVPYKKDLKNSAGIPAEATEMLSARSVSPLIVPEGHVGRSRTAPMYGYQGLYLSIAECAAADDGPPPHAHSDTQESFFVLDGAWEISTGFDREYAVTAKPYDIVAMPPGVMRAFANTGDKPARLFVIIQGPDRMNDTVSFSRRIGEEVERRFGKETIESYQRIKMTFDAEERLQG